MSILRIMTFPKAVRLVDFSKFEMHQIDPYPKSGLYIEWCDSQPDEEATFFIIERDGPRNAWVGIIPRNQFSKLIPTAIMAVA